MREDRLPLPLVALVDPAANTVLSLTHIKPNGDSFIGDRGLGPVIDSRMLFGSLGIISNRKPSLAFDFPGSEGERTYIAGRSDSPRWAERFHAVRSGARQEYELSIAWSHAPSFAAAVATVWQDAYGRFPQQLSAVDQGIVYAAGIEVLNKYWKDYDGVPGFPFSVALPDGSIKEESLQMGFVGQQIPAAVHLLRCGLENKKPELERKGAAIIDFWTQQSASEAGVLRTWHDVRPNRWRDYGTFLRIACDGAVGVLNGWKLMTQHGENRPEWLAFCESWGDWLVSHQNPDGSFFRQYDFNGVPLQDTKFNTTHPIRFLVDLSKATGKKEYEAAAINAGAFSQRTVHEDYKYVGGTPDNPDVVDKEAGLIAIDAFLALYDVTKDPRWLACAEQAACYAETWMYCWDVPMVAGDEKSDFPKGESTVGMSLISTGHSGADSFMAYYPFVYLRLYLYTGKTHYRDVAALMLCNTKQLQDLNGRLGYAVKGLHTEAMTIAVARGHSVRLWLPWLTVAALDPLVDLRDVFGAMNLAEIEASGLGAMKKRNEAYGASRGFPTSAGGVPRGQVAGWQYLDNIKESASSVGYGLLGKHGSHGYGSAGIALGGKKAEHALSTHPPRDGSASVTYRPLGKWSRFRATVGVSDSAAKPLADQCVFVLSGDGKPLWTSKPIKGKGQIHNCDVGIENVKEVTLKVMCRGDNAWAFAVWVEPQVLVK